MEKNNAHLLTCLQCQSTTPSFRIINTAIFFVSTPLPPPLFQKQHHQYYSPTNSPPTQPLPTLFRTLHPLPLLLQCLLLCCLLRHLYRSLHKKRLLPWADTLHAQQGNVDTVGSYCLFIGPGGVVVMEERINHYVCY